MRLLCISSIRASLSNVRPEAEWFIGLQRAGAQVTLLAEADADYAPLFRDAGVQVQDFSSSGKFDRKAIRQIRDRLDDTDIVFAMTNKTIANAVLALGDSKAKLVSYRGQTGNINRWDPTCYLTHLNPRIDAIVCVADAVRQSVAAQLRRPDKAVTIYKGHDPAWYSAIEPRRITDDTLPVIICVSNYRPRKGVETLIEAFGLLQTDAHLVLAGTGTDDPGLARLAQANIRAGRFHALGYCADPLSLTAAADIAVLPALRREGLPKTVIEAMACAVPPVVTDTGGNAELVEHGQSGLVVPPGSPRALAAALQSLCTDQDKRQRLATNARARIATNFHIRATVEQTMRLFNNLLD